MPEPGFPSSPETQEKPSGWNVLFGLAFVLLLIGLTVYAYELPMAEKPTTTVAATTSASGHGLSWQHIDEEFFSIDCPAPLLLIKSTPTHRSYQGLLSLDAGCGLAVVFVPELRNKPEYADVENTMMDVFLHSVHATNVTRQEGATGEGYPERHYTYLRNESAVEGQVTILATPGRIYTIWAVGPASVINPEEMGRYIQSFKSR